MLDQAETADHIKMADLADVEQVAAVERGGFANLLDSSGGIVSASSA